MVSPFPKSNKKVPEANMASGTKISSRYHPDYLRFIEVPSDSNKPYPCNGGNRVPLLSFWLFTEPTRESDCLNLLHRFAPTTGSLEHPKQANFPSLSLLYVFLSFNHKRGSLSTGSFSSFAGSFYGETGKMNIF
jgi:hypothetical protein